MGVWQTKRQLTGMLNVFAKSSPIKRRADWCKKFRQVIIITDLMVHLKMLRSIMATHSKHNDANKVRHKELMWNLHIFLGLKKWSSQIKYFWLTLGHLFIFKCRPHKINISLNWTESNEKNIVEIHWVGLNENEAISNANG